MKSLSFYVPKTVRKEAGELWPVIRLGSVLKFTPTINTQSTAESKKNSLWKRFFFLFFGCSENIFFLNGGNKIWSLSGIQQLKRATLTSNGTRVSTSTIKDPEDVFIAMSHFSKAPSWFTALERLEIWYPPVGSRLHPGQVANSFPFNKRDNVWTHSP